MKRLIFILLICALLVHLHAWAIEEKIVSVEVKLISVQMPDSSQIGVPFNITVSAQVKNSGSPKGGITVSFSKPVEIKITSTSASAKVYPQGSKLWNQNLKASIASKHTIAELWVENWQKDKIHQLSLDVTPKEAGDLEIFIRSTAMDAASGKSINAPTEGVLDQQGFPCEKRTVRIIVPKAPSADIKDLIKKLEDANESIRQEAKKQLLDKIWQESVRPIVEEDLARLGYIEADILLSDIDGNGAREIIASFLGLWEQELCGFIAVVDETLSNIDVIEVGGHEVPKVVKITDLLGEGKQALIIEGEQRGSDGRGSWIEIYQWRQGKFTEVWSKGIEEFWMDREASWRLDYLIGFFARAKVQIVDIDQDGVREIVRISEIYKSRDESRELLEKEQEAGRAKVEIEMGSSLDCATETFPVKFESDIDFGKVTSGYEHFYKFKETYFWNKDFNYYIQYKARITKDTMEKVGSESVSIVSGTVVGVLGFDLGISLLEEGFDPHSVYVVLPDGQITSVGKEILERIRSEDKRDR